MLERYPFACIASFHPSGPKEADMLELWRRDDSWPSMWSCWKWQFLWRWTRWVPHTWCGKWGLGWEVFEQYQKISWGKQFQSWITLSDLTRSVFLSCDIATSRNWIYCDYSSSVLNLIGNRPIEGYHVLQQINCHCWLWYWYTFKHWITLFQKKVSDYIVNPIKKVLSVWIYLQAST